jgi:hypothetical protein
MSKITETWPYCIGCQTKAPDHPSLHRSGLIPDDPIKGWIRISGNQYVCPSCAPNAEQRGKPVRYKKEKVRGPGIDQSGKVRGSGFANARPMQWRDKHEKLIQKNFEGKK